MEPSPYLPTSRRFANPLYLRPERIPEYATATEAQRAEVQGRRAQLDDRADLVERIDRNAGWAAKRAALEVIFAVPRTAGRERSLAAFRRREGEGLLDFATWAAAVGDLRRRRDRLAGGPPPSGRSRESRRSVPPMSGEIDFHCWLQWVLDEQLAGAHQAALRAGMGLGVMADLAVGVNRVGADAWSLQDSFAQRHHGGRATRSVQPERPELEPAAVAARPAGRDRVRAVPARWCRRSFGTPAASGSTT